MSVAFEDEFSLISPPFDWHVNGSDYQLSTGLGISGEKKNEKLPN